MILDFLEDLSSAAQDTGSVDDRLDAVESYICYELYDRYWGGKPVISIGDLFFNLERGEGCFRLQVATKLWRMRH